MGLTIWQRVAARPRTTGNTAGVAPIPSASRQSRRPRKEVGAQDSYASRRSRGMPVKDPESFVADSAGPGSVRGRAIYSARSACIGSIRDARRAGR